MTSKEINLKTINNESVIGTGNISVGGGSADIVTSWESTLSDTKVPSEKLTKNTLDTKANSSSLSTVATSGSYSDLSNKPSIPSSSSDLSDGEDIIMKSNTTGVIDNTGSIETNLNTIIDIVDLLGTDNQTLFSADSDNHVFFFNEKIAYDSLTGTVYYSDGLYFYELATVNDIPSLSGKEDTSNKVTSWSSTTTDTHYPSEKLVKDNLDTKQATLVSGTNIKTINNESLLGSGNITVSGGASTGTFTELATAISDAITNNNGVLTLDKDYKYDSTTDSTYVDGITISNNNIIIFGNGHIIDGNNSARAFYSRNSSGTTNNFIIDLTIQNCNRSGGGAIYTRQNSNFTLINCTLTKNTGNNGIIMGAYGANITLLNSIISYNTSTQGVIRCTDNSATVTINNSVINNNNSTSGNGGAISVSNCNIDAKNSVFINNGCSNGSGGGIYASLNSSTNVSVSNCTFAGNTAQNYANIYCSKSTVVYNNVLDNISTSCYNVTNVDYLATTIVDNLTTDDATKALSAKQGKALNDLIGSAITYIVGSGS